MEIVMRKLQKGFTLVELLVAVSLLAIVSLVSVNIIVTLLKGAVKAQMAIDIEQASSFVFLKMENDIKKSYDAEVTGSTLTLKQGSPTSAVTKTYKLASGASGECNAANLNCVITSNNVKLTDDTVVSGKPVISAVSVDLLASSFTIVRDSLNNPVAVDIKIKFEKPAATQTMFKAETTLDTTVVLRGSY